jgi:hypothetical protein
MNKTKINMTFGYLSLLAGGILLGFYAAYQEIWMLYLAIWLVAISTVKLFKG